MGPSPSATLGVPLRVRRWREAPDEGTGEAWRCHGECCRSPLRPNPLPNPSPDGRGTFVNSVSTPIRFP